jgi:hypothetical protein
MFSLLGRGRFAKLINSAVGERITMNKNTIVLLIVLVVGLLAGSILGKVLNPWVPFLSETADITWQPKADLDILKYDFFIQVKLNLASVLGLIIAFWVYKKL